MKSLIVATLILAASLAGAETTTKKQPAPEAGILVFGGSTEAAPESNDAKFFRLTIDLQMDGLILRGFQIKYKDTQDIGIKRAIGNAEAAYDAALISYSESMDQQKPDYDKVEERATRALTMIALIHQAAGGGK